MKRHTLPQDGTDMVKSELIAGNWHAPRGVRWGLAAAGAAWAMVLVSAMAAQAAVSFDRAFGVGVDTGGAAFENCTTATGCQVGPSSGAAGGVTLPTGVAVDAQGRILVPDSNNRISRFVVAGDGTVSFDRAFGVGVATGAAVFENCTTASGCQAGAPSSAAGGLSLNNLLAPAGVAVDAQGRILVADVFNNRISRFVVAGDGTVSFDRAFGIGVATGAAVFENCTTASGCQAGTLSSAAGGLFRPTGVAVDAQGRILVPDENHRISRFVVAGDGSVAFDRAFGIGVATGAAVFQNCTTATGCQVAIGGSTDDAGALSSPSGVAVDAQGRILVAESSNNRVSRFVVAGDGTVAFDRAFGVGVATGAAMFENCTIVTGCQNGAGSGAAGGLFMPHGVAVDAQGRILVANFVTNRVDRFTMQHVTYDGNGHTGGTVPVDDLTYETGDPVTVQANTGGLVRTGHALVGWNTRADGTGTAYDATGTDTFAMGAADVTLFAQWVPGANLMIAKFHTSPFTQGQGGRIYTITVSNAGGVVTSGLVTVTDQLPAGLTATALAGDGWACTLATLTCTRDDGLLPGASYPVILLTVAVDTDAVGLLTNTATVSVGGDVVPADNTATDLTVILPAFADVAPTDPFFDWIMALLAAGLTGGCGEAPPVFCPDDPVTRGQIAVLLVRALHGPDFFPPAATGIFADVPVGDAYARWIEQLFHDGITGGCQTSPLRYCPDAGLTRGQAALLLLRALSGPGFVPPPASGLFDDVPLDHPFVDWIEELLHRGITGGCGPSSFCPAALITRRQIAVWLTRAFELPL